MKQKFIIAPTAQYDLDEILSYIFEESPQAAFKMLEQLTKAMQRLAEMPKIGHLRQDLTKSNIRFWSGIKPYIIIYRDSNPVEIVRVVSHYRDIATLLD